MMYARRRGAFSCSMVVARARLGYLVLSTLWVRQLASPSMKGFGRRLGDMIGGFAVWLVGVLLSLLVVGVVSGIDDICSAESQLVSSRRDDNALVIFTFCPDYLRFATVEVRVVGKAFDLVLLGVYIWIVV